MSKPLENYIIRIKSSIDQFDNEGVIREEDRDHIELMTRGSFTKKNGSYYISYKETQTIGFEGCTTTIKIAEDGTGLATSTLIRLSAIVNYLQNYFRLSN